ncbi:phosphate ABC transporter substrate-binding protein [Colwellia sp. 12G3]|uniref:phosphate ABC transporter substrate-binding protein n=1 Tax=Colwellia sp. 12G3 TaxID=2058299 RepID=UPI000C32E828|nr:phosphate ABC transporter substrate-binding protein [Colwellia sp. 12G3]PKI16375.1 phosphate ABC transporter substrate-binding protein [Colwellia sp. 12G3]
MKFIISILLLTSLAISHTCYADVSIVVNTANGGAISDTEISRLFLGKLKKFSDGESAIPINSKAGTAARVVFEEKVLNKSSSQIKAYWSKRVFSGKGNPPTEVDNDAAVLSFVAENTGAIGYVDAASVDGTVKVVKTF